MLKVRFRSATPALVAVFLALGCPTQVRAADDLPPAAGPAAAGQGSAPALPAVDAVLARCVEAMGGRAALERINSCEARGEAEARHLGARVSVQLSAKAPGKRRVVFDVPGYGRVEEVCDGQKGWQADPVFGRTDWAGQELEQRRREAAFPLEIQLGRLYPGLRVAGAEFHNAEPVWVLEASGPERSQDRFFFSRKTGLLMRHDLQFAGPLGLVTRSVAFGDHRKVDGVMVAGRWEVRQRGAGQAEPEIMVKIGFTDIRLNVPVEDSQFTGGGTP